MRFFKRKKKYEEDAKESKDLKVESAPKKEVKKKEVKKDDSKHQKKDSPKKGDTKNAYKVLLRPHVTEKTAVLASGGKYVFEVQAKTNKIEIKKAIYNLYGIMPKSVNVINQMGKYRRLGRSAGRTKNWKKAVVILPKGKFIDVYTNV